MKILDDAVAKLQADPMINVTIEGHTDSIGTSEYNLALGERRANSVRDYLAKRGIAAGRMQTTSFGEERPIATNDTAAGRAMNRRAHLLLCCSKQHVGRVFRPALHDTNRRPGPVLWDPAFSYC